jgi:hypothetical protein
LDRVVDELGLVLEGEHLTVFIPVTGTAFVFRVRSRVNRGYEVINYGPLPLPANTPLLRFGGGLIPVPEYGVLPGLSYNPSTMPISFPTTLDVYDKSDMWFIPKEDRERLFHVKMFITPSWIRVSVDIPRGVPQRRFQKDRVVVDVDKPFGWSRGFIEVVRFPQVYYGYRVANDTNLNVRTFVRFVYGEYIVEIPKDPEFVFNILTRRYPSYWLTMPITVMDTTLRTALIETYGFEGFPLYPVNRKDEAVRAYAELLKGVKV